MAENCRCQINGRGRIFRTYADPETTALDDQEGMLLEWAKPAILTSADPGLG